MTESDFGDLLAAVKRAIGADPALDRRIASTLDSQFADRSVPPYTASVDDCIALLDRVLPDWSWHVGYGPKGVLPYASVHNGEDRFVSSAPTVPLALLAALLTARVAQDKRGVLSH